MKKTMLRVSALLIAVITVLCVFAVSASAATQKSYGGKYGIVKTVKKDFKTKCTAYSVKGDSANIYLYFDAADGISDSQRDRTYYGFALYSDSAYKNVLVNLSGYFPKKDSTATVPVNLSSLESGVYYGIVYTWIKNSKGTVIIDKDTIVQFTLTANKVGNSTPSLNGVETTVKGNVISWGAVKYADKYKVLRKLYGEDKWTEIAETSSTSYVDNTATHGEKYVYTVKAYDGKYASKYNTLGVTAVFLDAPKVNECELLDDNVIKISWSKVKGAGGYYIYKKTSSSGAYTRLCKVSSKTSEYLDKSSKSDGTTYYYKIRAYSGVSAGLTSAAVKIKPFLTQKITAVYENGESVIKWKDSGDASYTLYKKTGSGKWKTVLKTSEEYVYNDNDVETGKKYSYSLVVEKNGKKSSFDTKGVSVIALGDTVIKSVENSMDNSVLIKWKAVEGATGYRILRKTAGEDYECVGTTSKKSFYDTTPKKNNLKYSYSVQAVTKNSYGSNGIEIVSFLYMEAPVMNDVKVNSNGTNTISWNSVKGATSYTVMRKTPGGSWSVTGSTESLKYTDKSAEKGDKYYYTVCAMNGSVKGAFCSGKGVNCLDAPKTVSTKKADTGIKISWSEVDGATGYYIYRKVPDGSWEKIGSSKSLSFIDKSSKTSGKTYIYSVKGYNKSGNGLLNPFGKSITA